jgi:hypothetical protein
MDRLTVLRLAGVSSAAAFTGGKYLGDPSIAFAMNPRFDRVLRLASGAVVASGPTGFAPDEARARVYAHVAQGARVQAGQTGWIRGASWSAVLTGPALKPGAADAYGVAYVENHDGTYEWYPWGLAVSLR